MPLYWYYCTVLSFTGINIQVAELRHLKKKKAKWRQERATEDSFLLERLASTYHSQGPEEKWVGRA